MVEHNRATTRRKQASDWMDTLQKITESGSGNNNNAKKIANQNAKETYRKKKRSTRPHSKRAN